MNKWLQRKELKVARKALQLWCNKVAYNEGPTTLRGLYERTSKVRKEFFEAYPQYKQFAMNLDIRWNLFPCNGKDATGIPEVLITEGV